MSKVICDLCGTSFPDTATQCPICGTARPASAPANDDSHRDGKSGYTHVKGGRFSKANVRKRNKGKQVVSVNMVSDSDDNGNKSNKWIVIIAIVLLLAILAVAAYIVLHYFNSGSDQQETTQQTETSEVTEITVPCVELSVEFGSILFEEVDGSQLLDVHVMPDDTTDMITFESEDTNIAVVSADGVVTAVAPGETNIIIRCGNQSCNVLVECKFELPEQDTTDATTDATEE